ncbi:MAG: hypothetical protein VYE64_11750 [Planctomycetota bacterium]|nr:hypothetical protein [Planctomycetota bacterium]
MNLLTEIKRSAGRRSGISVVEVLSAMVVALIGVFGVMVLIPFSVQQAQSGLDKDEATTVGRNAFAQFEIQGFRFVDSDDQSRMVGAAGQAAIGTNPNVGVVDPLWVTENGAYPAFCGFATFNLLDPANQPFSQAMARQLCRSTDDLQFQSTAENLPAGTDAGLLPPQQIFDVNGTGDDARRQSLGRISWNAVMVPVKVDYANAPSGGTPGLTFRMHVLVHKDRDLGPVNQVAYPQATVADPIGMVGFGGGTVTLDRKLVDVRRDDWVMLKTPAPPANPNTPSPDRNYLNQVGFYRVTNAAEIENNGNAVTILTLDGPDFNFGNAGTTELHHLVGFRDQKRSGQVINVYERTMQWERKSNWN